MTIHRSLRVLLLLTLLSPAANVARADGSAPGAPTASVPAATISPDAAPPRLSTDAVPTSEAVDLTLDPEQTDYHGHVTIGLSVRHPVDQLRFHARAMTIDSVSLRGRAGRVGVTGIERLGTDQARIRLAAAIVPGAYTLTVDFHNRFNTKAVALYRVVTGGHAYLFTQFEDTEAREAFPCWDEPSFKVPWTLELEVPAGDLAVGNTPIEREVRMGDSKRVVFARTRPLSSYLIAIAVGPFETVPITGMHMPGRVVTVQGASAMAAEAVKVTPAIIRSLERYFGRPYPFEKLDLIAAPEFLYGAMENAGAIVFADRRLLIDRRSVGPEQERQMTGVVAHEIAHQWFGDLVTMKWWDDLWLNESFASWMATKVQEDVAPETKSEVSTLFSIERAFAIDSRPSSGAMRARITGATSLGQTANELTYNKGEAVLTMFEGWLGRDRFRAGVLDYLKAHEWSNAEGRDLWLALGHVSGENIDAAMATFLDQAGVPLVTIEPLDGARVRLSQSRFISTGREEHAQTWRVPVILRYPVAGRIETRRVWLTRPDTTVDLGGGRRPDWIEPNAGGSGYYRWSVPDPMLESLVAAADKLDPRERIDLIANLTADLRGAGLHGDRYLEFMARLADDPSPEVTRAAIDGLNEMRVALATPESEPAAAAFLRESLAPALRRFGMRPTAGENVGVSLMRPALLRLLATGAHDREVIGYMDSLSRAYRNDPSSIPASLSESGIVLGAINGDHAQFDDYRRRFETTTVPIERTMYLAGLGSFRDPALRKAALEYTLKGPLRPQEVLMIPSAMSISSLGVEGRNGGGFYSDEITHWVMEHFAELSARMPPNFSLRLMSFGGGCGEDRVRELETFFNDPAHKVQGGSSALSRLEDVIRECTQVHERESARVSRWLLSRPGAKTAAF